MSHWVVAADGLNVRRTPEVLADNILGSLSRGQLAVLLSASETNNWWLIRASSSPHLTGYVDGSYLRPVTEEEAPVPLVQLRSSVFDDSASLPLKTFLTIHPPSAIPKQDEVIGVQRSRLVEANFDALLFAKFEAGGANYIRAYFHRSWGLSYDAFDPATIGLYVVFDAVAKTCTITNGLSKLEWLLEGNGLAVTDIANTGAYDALWETKVTGAIVKDPTKRSVLEELDLSPPAIVQQYRELQSLYTFANGLSEKADELAHSGFGAGSNTEDETIDRLMGRFLKMKAPKTDIDATKVRLKSKAASLGYLLCIAAEEKYTYPDKSELTLKEGELYQPYLTTITWDTRHSRTATRTVSVGVWPFEYRETQTYEIVDIEHHTKAVTKYDKKLTDVDPTIEKRNQLLKEGFSEPYIFERQGGAYLTASGASLEEILTFCDRDETFRLTCAIFLPVYEQKLTKGEILVKYQVIKRPLPGLKPIAVPKLYLEERITYVSSWNRTEIGELIHGINLAPGEDRTIVIDRSSSRDTEDRRTATSLIDITEAQSLDLSTEIEKEARSSTESTSSSNWSASAGGSYGPFTASGSAGGSSTQTAKQFAGVIEKVAKKAASSLTKKMRQEVSSSTSVKVNVTSKETTTIKVKNFNEGRTLNLFFFQLYNIYAGKVLLDEMDFVVLPAREIVAGSGIRLPQVYRRGALRAALREMAPELLPFRLKGSELNNQQAVFTEYWNILLNEFEATLKTEYGDNSATASTVAPASVQAITFMGSPVKVLAGQSLDLAAGEDVPARIRRITEEITDMIFNRRPYLETELKVATDSVYLDSFVGVRPSTEPFAEEMRAHEVYAKSADTEKVRAAAAYQNALAFQISEGRYPNSARNGVTPVFGVVLSLRKLRLTAKDKFPKGVWLLWCDGTVKTHFETDGSSSVKTISWTSDQDWLSEGLPTEAIIINRDTGEVLSLQAEV